MAITVNWPTKVVSVPKADTQLVQASPTEIRLLDLDAFRLALKALEYGEEGMLFLTTHVHVPPVDVGGVTLARVVELINGYTVTFEDGQYAVNLSGANSNVGDVVNVNQVSVRSANSAGLTYSKQVEDSAFGDQRVWVNTVSGLPGTLYPRGTTSDPVSNLADAQAIIEARGLPKRLHLTGHVVLTGTDSVMDYDITGASSILASLDVEPEANTTNLVIRQLSMTGDLNGNITAEDSVSFSDIIDFDGVLDRCGISGNIKLGSGGNRHELNDCRSQMEGTAKPAIDCDDLDLLSVGIRDYTGGLIIRNYSGSDNLMSIDLDSGDVLLEPTCTSGLIVVRGVGGLDDQSGSGCTVIRTALVDPAEGHLTHKILRNKITTDPDSGKATIYDDDGSVLLEGELYEDAAGTISYRGQGSERRERLE